MNEKERKAAAKRFAENWIRNRGTIEILGTWEIIHHPNFKGSSEIWSDRIQIIVLKRRRLLNYLYI